jgi:long-chain acyl-CoA synthetase
MDAGMNRQSRAWLKFYDEGVPPAIDYPPLPLDRYLASSAASFPARPAILFGSRVGRRILDASLSYRQLDRAVDRFTAAIQELGTRRGDRVAIHLPNCPQFVIAFYGTLRAGAIAVPCNPLYAPGELAHQLSDAGAEILVTLTSFYHKVQAVRPQTKLRHVVATNIKEYFPPLLRLLFTLTKESQGGHRTQLSCDSDLAFQSLLEGAPAKAPANAGVGPEDTACLLYTGGTTGTPRGAQLLHRNLLSNAIAGSLWCHARQAREVILGALPLFHSYGMTTVMNVSMVIAGTMILIPDPRDILHIMGSIARHQATFFPAVPTLYAAVNSHPLVRQFDLRSVVACQSGAAPLPGQVQERFQELTGARLAEGYGLTEASPVTHSNPMHGSNKVGSIGLPWPDTDARIVDVDTGEKELVVGEIGELVIQGPQVMKGYWEQPTETANVLRLHPSLGRGLWLHTGDIARMDEQGYFQIVDRKKDMIICGGYNVYPRDVEEVLYRHPAVKEAAVAGIPDAYRGETVKAFVVLREGMAATEAEIIAFCREHLARYKVPTAVEFRQDLPKSTVGKIVRRELVRSKPVPNP